MAALDVKKREFCSSTVHMVHVKWKQTDSSGGKDSVNWLEIGEIKQ